METAKPIVWSFSSLKTFQQCPKKYYHTKVAKDVIETGSDATRYGTSFHLVAEEYIRDGKEIPPQFLQYKPLLDSLAAIPGVKLCEVKLGLTKDYQACDFSAPDVWWHGIADLVILNETTGVAHSIDYKTSKSARYADLGQLDLVAAGIFAQFPNITKIKSALAFVVSGEFIPKTHYREQFNDYLARPAKEVARIGKALETGVWNPVPGKLCGFCSVTSCVYNDRY